MISVFKNSNYEIDSNNKLCFYKSEPFKYIVVRKTLYFRVYLESMNFLYRNYLNANKPNRTVEERRS
jgi:hypothetical protein